MNIYGRLMGIMSEVPALTELKITATYGMILSGTYADVNSTERARYRKLARDTCTNEFFEEIEIGGALRIRLTAAGLGLAALLMTMDELSYDFLVKLRRTNRPYELALLVHLLSTERYGSSVKDLCGDKMSELKMLTGLDRNIIRQRAATFFAFKNKMERSREQA